MIGVTFNRVSAAPLMDDKFSFSYVSWVANTVDTLNEALNITQNQLNGIGVATFPVRKTSAEISALINMNAFPVLEVGALWFDTTIKKLKFLATAAVPGMSNGITETVTSV